MRTKQFISGLYLAATVLLFGTASTALGGEIFDPNQIVDPNPVNFNSLLTGVAVQDQPAGFLDDLRDNEGIEFLNLDGGEVVIGFGDQLIDVTGAGQGNSDGVIEISFVDPVEAAGVDYWTGTELHLLAYDVSDNLILGLDVTVGSGAGFIGIDGEGTLIKRIVIHDSIWGFGIDNLRRGPTHVPLPGAALLGVVGLAAVGWVKRRLL